MTATMVSASSVPRSASSVAAQVRSTPRTDIQALRALAVTLVFAYHLWPSHLSGGFVGVDVFFVISGFLISSHLLSHPPHGAGDLARFWSRRIKRLLPASLLVLAATLIASRLVAPETQWANTARQAGAAALYVVNWLLAADSVDYLAAENAPTPVQHFWSLSVEEQFYFVWPVLIGLLVWLAVRRRSPRIVLVGLSLIVVGSLAYSGWKTATAPAAAYFVTPTRAWEFALGGVLACVVTRIDEDPDFRRSWRLTSRGRTVIAAVGLAAIALAAILYTSATPFPSWTAGLPTAGAVAVMAAGLRAGDGLLGRCMALRGVQWLGDVSYSVYLWHWPLIVLVPYVSGQLGLLDQAAIVLVTLLLAALTKHYVEDRFRFVQLPPRPIFLLAAGGMAAVLTLSGLQVAELKWRQHQAAVAESHSAQDPCFGAAALIRPDVCREARHDALVPAPAQAADDKSAAYAEVGGRDCWSTGPRFDLVTCQFGRPEGATRVALVGNSHAGQWLPTLQALADTNDLRITTYLASRCAYAAVDQNLPTRAQTRACRSWVDRVTAALVAGDYDVVVLTNRMSVSAKNSSSAAQSERAYQEGYRSVLKSLSGRAPILALHDTPAPGDAGIESIPDCIAENPDDLAACSGKRSAWVPAEPMQAAFAAVSPTDSGFADLNDAICERRSCSPVVGGAIVYSDGSHLTATNATTLAPALRPALDRVLALAR